MAGITESSEAWEWRAPDYSELDTVWRNPLPYILWPVGGQSLIDHWMDDAVRRGVKRVVLHVADRPSEVRSHLRGGAYWSVEVEVRPVRDESDAPSGAVRLAGLPGADPEADPPTPQALLERWLGMQGQWLDSRNPEKVSVDSRREPGGWVGPHARIHPSAELHPPYWIGGRAEVGAGSRIGPSAFVGSGSLLDGSVQVEDAVVLPETYVGHNTRIHQAVAGAGLLVDIKRGCRVEIPETFILSRARALRRGSRWPTRLLALAAYLALAPLAPLAGRRPAIQTVSGIRVFTGKRGPLLLRRWSWFRHVAAGSMRLSGVLPRAEASLAGLPEETAARLREFPAGMLSWADLNGCHDVDDPEEWIHAIYQATHDRVETARTLRANALGILWSNPSRHD